MAGEIEGIEYELTEFLIMTTQDELNAASIIQAKIDSDKRFMNMFDDSPSSVNYEHVAGDEMNAMLPVSSCVTESTIKPGYQNGVHRHVITPDDNDGLGQVKIKRQLQEIEGVLSWRDEITDQIFVGLGLRQGELAVPESEGKHTQIEAIAESSNVHHHDPMKAAKAFLKGLARTDTQDDETTDRCVQDVLSYDSKKDANVPRDADSPTTIEFDRPDRNSADSKNDVVKELITKCLLDNNANKFAKSISNKDPLAQISVTDIRDDSSIQRSDTSAGAMYCSESSEGLKNDLMKKLVAKCLASNKKYTGPLDLNVRLLSEPDSHNYADPHPEICLPLSSCYKDMESNHNLCAYEQERIDCLIGLNEYRDQPETRKTPQQIQLRNFQVKWNANSTTPIKSDARPGGEPLQLKFENTDKVSNYHFQPLRSKAPFNSEEELTKYMKNLSKRVSSLRHANAEVKLAESKRTPFEESALSPIAALRCRHYKELLIKEKAAKKAAE